MAQDDWVDDEYVLAEITRSEDFTGEWWNVPIEHLRSCMMALSYLDAKGMAFYLPAYMTALIERPEDFDTATRSASWQVVLTMLPADKDPEQKQYFLRRFAFIDVERKRVCREFLAYLSEHDAYHEHARQTAKDALVHEFWAQS